MMIEIAIVFALIVANGVFALSEMAIVSARRARLMSMAEHGSAGARTALQLAEDPGRFLSTVQIGITLIGIVAGAFGGATLSADLAALLGAWEPVRDIADETAFVLVVAMITYFSLIVGELVPKQLSLRNPERVAVVVARPMAFLSRMATPAVVLLDASTRLCLGLFGRKTADEDTVTEEEVRTLIAEGTRAGVFEHAEKEMIERVLRLADRGVRAIMTPRVDVAWLDVDADAQTVLATLRTHGYSRYPVGRGGIDEPLGVVQAKDLLDRALSGQPFDLAATAVPAPVLPDSIDALRALEVLRGSRIHLALIVDEYGSFEGIVTAGDVLRSVVGEMDQPSPEQAEIVRRDDGTWLVDGSLPVDELRDLLKVRALPEDEDYHTLAGFVLTRLRQVPEEGQSFVWQAWRFEVVDMDGRRIDKVLIGPAEPSA